MIRTEHIPEIATINHRAYSPLRDELLPEVGRIELVRSFLQIRLLAELFRTLCRGDAVPHDEHEVFGHVLQSSDEAVEPRRMTPSQIKLTLKLLLITVLKHLIATNLKKAR